jgi:hypothetical protein
MHYYILQIHLTSGSKCSGELQLADLEIILEECSDISEVYCNSLFLTHGHVWWMYEWQW